MRWTVLSSDLLVFFPAALWFVWAYMKVGIGISGEERREGWMWLLAMVLISPCLVLIDHGHFQVSFTALTNNVCDLGGGKCADQQSALRFILFVG